MDQTKEQLKNIIDNNPDIEKRMKIENWDIKYRKSSNMIIMGTQFPKDSFYFYVNGSGVMARIDKNNKIYGFAIENARFFIKKNPEIGWFFYPLVYPIKFFWMNLIWKSTDKIKKMTVVSDYIAGEACYV
ncbi:MAG: hypothetical protein ABIJ91_02345 [Candidatus Kuenenbacteria bacterium]